MKRFDDLPDATKELLSSLSQEDARTLKTALPVLRSIMGFARVTKWIIYALLGILGGVVLFGESVMKIIGWFRGA